MHIRTSLAVRALRGARTGPAAVCGAVALALASAAGGPSAAVPAVAAVTLAVLLVTALTGRPRPGLTGIARSWARAHPWRYAAGPAAALTVVLLAVDAATGWPYIGAVLAGLSVPAAPRIAAGRRTARTPVRAPAPLTGRRLVRALPREAPPSRVPAMSSRP